MYLTTFRVLIWQLIFGISFAIILWGFFGKIVAYSSALGSLICVIPNAFLASRIEATKGTSKAKVLVSAAWIGEIGKLALTVILFISVFQLVKPLAILALFIGYISTQLVLFIGFFMHNKQEMDISNGS
tara:strand:- start:594 stop:980 length:387 start_codon:yes stop_codon:yes gene_type:complete